MGVQECWWSISRPQNGSESLSKCVLYITEVKPPQVTDEWFSLVRRRSLFVGSGVSERNACAKGNTTRTRVTVPAAGR